MCLLEVFYTSYVLLHIERIHSRGQHICIFIGTKESVCIWKEFNSHRIVLVHQHGCRFIVLEHQYGRRDVMWKHSICLRSFAINVYLIKNVLFMSPQLPDFFFLFVCFSFFSKEWLFLFYINKKSQRKERRTNKRKERKHVRTKWYPKEQ